MTLRLHAVESPVTVLGPGKRFGVWTQGCCRRCPGCMSPGTWELSGGFETEPAALADKFRSSGCAEVTISGGEPFLQSAALAAFLQLAGWPGVIVYTGFLYEELLEMPDASPLLGVCDLLIDGAFVQELCDGRALRGSSNQRAILLTERYRDLLADFGTSPCRVEFFSHQNAMRMVGIPTPEWLERAGRIGKP